MRAIRCRDHGSEVQGEFYIRFLSPLRSAFLLHKVCYNVIT